MVARSMSKGSDSEATIIREMVQRAAGRWPDRVALVFDASGEQFTFAELESRTNRVANFLTDECGIAAGDKVALMLPNISAYPLFWLALAKLGAITVPLNPAYRMEDARHLLTHSGARLIVTTREHLEIVEEIRRASTDLKHVLLLNADGGGEPLFEKIRSHADRPPTVDILPDTVTNIQYTSGTTGLPKGCLLTNRYWMQIADVIVSSMKPELGVEDVILTAQPFSYIDPHWNLIVSLCSGARLVVLERFRPSQFWSKVAKHGVTFFYCLGAMPTLLLKMPVSGDETAHRVRRVVCSGIPADRHAELEERYGAPWVEAYGTTETGADISDWTLEDHAGLVGSGCLGTVSPYRVARVIDEDGKDVGIDEVGQLILKGPGIMLGYYRNEAATAAAIRDGWYHSGDLVRRDAQGRFFFSSRQKDMIRRGGENISAAEVEAVLQMHPDVVIAACVPVADDLREEEVKAYIVLRDQGGDLSAKLAEIIEFSSARLARFKIPRHWEFRTELPMTPSERVKKNELSSGAGQWARYDRVTGHWSNALHGK